MNTIEDDMTSDRSELINRGRRMSLDEAVDHAMDALRKSTTPQPPQSSAQ